MLPTSFCQSNSCTGLVLKLDLQISPSLQWFKNKLLLSFRNEAYSSASWRFIVWTAATCCCCWRHLHAGSCAHCDKAVKPTKRACIVHWPFRQRPLARCNVKTQLPLLSWIVSEDGRRVQLIADNSPSLCARLGLRLHACTCGCLPFADIDWDTFVAPMRSNLLLPKWRSEMPPNQYTSSELLCFQYNFWLFDPLRNKTLDQNVNWVRSSSFLNYSCSSNV